MYKWNIYMKIGYFMILKRFFYGIILYIWFIEYKYNVYLNKVNIKR